MKLFLIFLLACLPLTAGDHTVSGTFKTHCEVNGYEVLCDPDPGFNSKPNIIETEPLITRWVNVNYWTLEKIEGKFEVIGSSTPLHLGLRSDGVVVWR